MGISGWWFGSCDASNRLPAGTAVQTDREVVRLGLAMSLELPAQFGMYSSGQRFNIVADLHCWDPSHECHRFRAVHSGVDFVAHGLLVGEGERFSLINAEFRRQFPIPMVGIDEKTRILCHQVPSWTSMYQVIEICAGFGGITQGLATSGFHTVAAVESNPRMSQLFQMQSTAEVITGDINEVSTLLRIWDVAPGAGTFAAGFNCQPFSRLGDGRGGEDSRALCLRSILACAFFLQAQAIVLECVEPAAKHSFVVGEVNKFLELTGYQSTQCVLHLSDVWPCRRSRAWWIITSPLLGKIPVDSWPRMQIVSKVRHVISQIQPWDVDDEKALTLRPNEMIAFGANDDSFHRFLLNFEGLAPCALHSWGSQVEACECGCRLFGLSEHRLREKGLLDVLWSRVQLNFTTQPWDISIQMKWCFCVRFILWSTSAQTHDWLLLLLDRWPAQCKLPGCLHTLMRDSNNCRASP